MRVLVPGVSVFAHTKRTFIRAAASSLGLAFGLPRASALSISFAASGTSSNGTLHAQVDFTDREGFIDVILTNLLGANFFRSAGQALSEITFTLSAAAGTIGTTSASGQLGNVSGNPNLGRVTYVSGSPTLWLGADNQGRLQLAGDTIKLKAIGGVQPSQMIITIMANGFKLRNVNNELRNFGPYITGPACFVLSLSEVRADTRVTSATFSFGPRPDTFLTGTPLRFPFH